MKFVTIFLKTKPIFLNTSKMFMNIKKTYTAVIFAQNVSIVSGTYKLTSKPFTKVTKYGKSFTEAGSLKKHIKTIHEGHTDFKCDSCGKSFTQAGTLRIHIKTIHEGHKDFKCDSCGKSFTQAGDLRQHIKTIHQGFKISNVTLVENHFLDQII